MAQSSNRKTTGDFVASVAQASVASTPTKPATKYVAQANGDGTFAVLKNGVVLYPRVFWSGIGGPITDASPVGDKVCIWDASGTSHVGSAAEFLRNLV